MSYVPLQVFGHHSLLRGVVSPSEWIRSASALGFTTCALTDRHALMGSVAFVKAARSAGIRPLLGVDFDHAAIRATALARNARGLAALHRAISGVHGNSPDRILADLSRAAADLVVLVSDPDFLPHAAGAFGNSLWAAVIRLPGERPNQLREVAHTLGVPAVAAGAVHFRDAQDHALHRLVRAIAGRTTMARVRADELVSQKARLLTNAAFRARHRGEEELVAATHRVAEQCELELELDRPRLPHIELPAGETAEGRLRRLAVAGAERHFGMPLPPLVHERLERELSVIGALDFASYFLIVDEIVAFAREQGIPFVGRGSAANSLVVFCLGITRVDPLAYDLVFERFLTPSRRSLPDIDLDFCWRRRDEVIAHVYARYGADRVATICTHITLKSRSAFREAAKALGFSATELRRGSFQSVSEPDRSESAPHPLGVGEDSDHRLHLARRLARRLRGLPRHLGMHPGGIVISDRPLYWTTPVVPSAKGPLITQHEMRAIESLGLVKIDLLGQRSLSTIGDTVALLKKTGEPVPRLEELPDEDPAVRALLQSGRTLGCFQIESPGMRKLLIEMGARSRREVIDAISLIRPGPAGAGMKDAYIRRARGQEPVSYPHPCLVPVLSRTFGIMLYQEDILRVCAALAGWTLEEGDILRAALGKKKDPSLLVALKQRYQEEAQARGIERIVADAVWESIGRFAAFSYCKAHAAVYGHLAFEELWLKSRYPAAYFCAVLRNDRGYYPDRVYVEEARRWGVRFLLPDVNRSALELDLDQGAIRLGLASIKGMSARTLDRLLTDRTQNGPFFSLRELHERVQPDRREARHLILAGACDAWDRPRPELLWRLELLRREAPEPACPLFPPGRRHEPVLPRLPDYDERRKRRLEYSLLGLPIFGGAAVFGQPDPAWSVTAAVDLPAAAGRVVNTFGWCSATRRTRTKKGPSMRFITLEDQTGPIEGVFFPDVETRLGDRITDEGPYFMRGLVEETHGAIVIRVMDFAAQPSRDALPSPFLPHRERDDIDDWLVPG